MNRKINGSRGKTPQTISCKFYMPSSNLRSQVGAAGIDTGFGLDYLRVRHQILAGPRIFLSPHCPNQLWGATQHPVHWI
jgi:hypothetical protein